MSERQHPAAPPRTGSKPAPPRETPRCSSLVNTGDGKGKSTAAFGVMLRGLARGWRVSVIQFDTDRVE
jgi:cob(I)alamin adenosyltransferase